MIFGGFVRGLVTVLDIFDPSRKIVLLGFTSCLATVWLVFAKYLDDIVLTRSTVLRTLSVESVAVCYAIVRE